MVIYLYVKMVKSQKWGDEVIVSASEKFKIIKLIINKYKLKNIISYLCNISKSFKIDIVIDIIDKLIKNNSSLHCYYNFQRLIEFKKDDSC